MVQSVGATTDDDILPVSDGDEAASDGDRAEEAAVALPAIGVCTAAAAEDMVTGARLSPNASATDG